jgi:hypothetical protein
MNSAMSLSLPCGIGTDQYFYDVQEAKNGCVTPAKADGLQQRMQREQSAKAVKIKEYLARVESGEWTVQKFADMKALLNSTTLTETAIVTGTRPDGTPIIECASPDQVNEMLRHLEEALSGGTLPLPRSPQPSTPHRIKV